VIGGILSSTFLMLAVLPLLLRGLLQREKDSDGDGTEHAVLSAAGSDIVSSSTT
jgi:hypothetical protein